MLKKFNQFIKESKEDKKDLLDFIDGKDDIDVKENDYETTINYKTKKEIIYDFEPIEDAIKDEDKNLSMKLMKKIKNEYPNIVSDEKYLNLLKKINILK
ncbi:hypothetical protein M0Q50_02560 [bacterium]|jgi:glycerol-3-phosphate cytidylyltransferase-like family protein|nr:hypothetical protein [bacterium]